MGGHLQLKLCGKYEKMYDIIDNIYETIHTQCKSNKFEYISSIGSLNISDILFGISVGYKIKRFA